jgi:uncharacterized protein (TIGR02594 family)
MMNKYTAAFVSIGVPYTDCPWMQCAAAEATAGVHETRGPGSNPRVAEYLRVVGFADDSVPWCSAFANWCMKEAGFVGSGRANARSWLHWGKAIAACKLGAVAVFSRGNQPHQGHVGFYAGVDGSNLLVLGGNQHDAVCVRAYPSNHLLNMRWPT